MKSVYIFLVLFVSLVTTTIAQSWDPYLHCDGNPFCPWSNDITDTMTCGGCDYIIEYCTRICNQPPYNGVPHFKIKRLELIDFLNCQGGCDSTDLLKQTGAAIILANHDWWDNLEPDSCLNEIQGYHAACWWWPGAMPDGNLGYEPCNLTSCCRQIWFICKNSEGDILPPVLQGVQNIVPCDPPHTPSNCETCCEPD